MEFEGKTILARLNYSAPPLQILKANGTSTALRDMLDKICSGDSLHPFRKPNFQTNYNVFKSNYQIKMSVIRQQKS